MMSMIFHPIVNKLLHLDYVQSFKYGTHDLVGIDHDSLELFLFAFLLQLVSQIIFFVSWLFSHINVHEV